MAHHLVRRTALVLIAHGQQRTVALSIARLKAKAQYSTIVAYLLPSQFGMSELHEAYQQVLGRRIDRANFRRKMLELGGLSSVGVSPTTVHRGRPREQFELKRADALALFDRSLA